MVCRYDLKEPEREKFQWPPDVAPQESMEEFPYELGPMEVA
jgi:hypothetical protein